MPYGDGPFSLWRGSASGQVRLTADRSGTVASGMSAWICRQSPVAPGGALEQMDLDSGGQATEAVGKMGAFPCLFPRALRAR